MTETNGTAAASPLVTITLDTPIGYEGWDFAEGPTGPIREDIGGAVKAARERVLATVKDTAAELIAQVLKDGLR